MTPSTRRSCRSSNAYFGRPADQEADILVGRASVPACRASGNQLNFTAEGGEKRGDLGEAGALIAQAGEQRDGSFEYPVLGGDFLLGVRHRPILRKNGVDGQRVSSKPLFVLSQVSGVTPRSRSLYFSTLLVGV